MSTLKVDFLGFALKNPFLLASAPPTNTVEMIARAFDELVSEKHADYWMDGIARLRRDYPTGSSWRRSWPTPRPKETGSSWRAGPRRGGVRRRADFSCPYGGMPPHAVGAAIGQDPAIASRITRWVRAAAGCVAAAPATDRARAGARAEAAAAAGARAA